MSIDKLFVAIVSLVSIVFVYWYFLKRNIETKVVSNDFVDITVKGGYSPEVISIPVGRTTKLNFVRKDPSSCLEEIVLSDFKIKKFLPFNKITTIEITPKTKGEYEVSCGMNMFHGKIIVK